MAPDLLRGISLFLDEGVKAGFERIRRKEDAHQIKTLKQIHKANGFQVDRSFPTYSKEGDFLWTTEANLAIGVFVADCTAVLVSGFSKQTKDPIIGAIHAGWRGTAAKIIPKAIEEMGLAPLFRVWLSPAICRDHFEVGLEVIDALGGSSVKEFVKASWNPQKVFLDLRALQAKELRQMGAGTIEISPLCTFCENELVSYRRAKGSLEERQLAWILREETPSVFC